MKLLEVLPEIAKKTQLRFAANFLDILANCEAVEISDKCYLVHFEAKDGCGWFKTYCLPDVISTAVSYGKDCQIMQIDANGDVNRLF